jgi:hypothetical protein
VGSRSSAGSSSPKAAREATAQREHQERQAPRPTIYNDCAGVRLYLYRSPIENKRLAPYPCGSFLSLPRPITSFPSRPEAIAKPLLSLYLVPYVSSVGMAPQKVHWRITQLQYLLLKYSQQPLRGTSSLLQMTPRCASTWAQCRSCSVVSWSTCLRSSVALCCCLANCSRSSRSRSAYSGSCSSCSCSRSTDSCPTCSRSRRCRFCSCFLQSPNSMRAHSSLATAHAASPSVDGRVPCCPAAL